ncbi:MAG: 30S ribosomal protein S20 [Patescibacteria group bacterium]|nr:30S ribosomal protein S20 [Patescibacteria group bacterium]
MPNTKSAKKKLRKDKKRTKENLTILNLAEKILDQIKKSLKKNQKDISELIKKYYSVVDKMEKKHIIHKNKGSRLKSRVMKLINKNKRQ